MENALLVGLSRQMMLERQMDVVANNVANVNTNGFKADKSLFQEYLKSGAHEDNFVGADRRVSYVQDRGTFKDFSQGPPSRPRIRWMSRSTAAASWWCRRPPASATPATARLQINNQGQLVTAAGNPVLGTSGPIVFQPTDHDVSDCRRRQRHRARRHQPDRLGARQAAAGQFRRRRRQLLKEGSNLYSAGEGAAAQPDTASKVHQGFIEKSNVNSVAEMSRMIEVTRTYTQISTCCSSRATCTNPPIEKLRRRSGVRTD